MWWKGNISRFVTFYLIIRFLEVATLICYSHKSNSRLQSAKKVATTSFGLENFSEPSEMKTDSSELSYPKLPI